MKSTTCCFIGHRKIEKNTLSKEILTEIIIEQIQNGVHIFIFGDHSEFNDFCYDIVTELQLNYPHIQRIKYRKDYQEISEENKRYFLAGFENSICPPKVASAGKASYVERNQAMINDSDICIFYYNSDYQPQRRKESKHSIGTDQPKSGTRIAYEFALSKHKNVINVYK